METDLLLRDTLTGAYNRAALFERLREETERARRYALPLSLILIELDRFEAVSESLGQTRGDEILAEFARLIEEQIRSADLLFHDEGGRFALLLPNTDKQHAVTLAGRLVDQAELHRFEGEPVLRFSVSIGVASRPESWNLENADLYERATRRLNLARRKGGGQVVDEDSPARAALAFELPAYMEERGPALAALVEFFNLLPQRKRGLLCVRGPRGDGKPDFLTHVAREADERGYLVLRLRAAPALRERRFGAIYEAQAAAGAEDPVWKHLPDPVEEHAFGLALRKLVLQGKPGLLIVVDELPELDSASMGLARRLLFAADIPAAALAYSVEDDSNRQTPLLDAPFQAEIELSAFSLPGMQLWLRDVLQWEPPEAFVEWLYRETGGLPADLRRALAILAESDILRPVETGWTLNPGYRSLLLGVKLNAERQKLAAGARGFPKWRIPFVGRCFELSNVKWAAANTPLVTLTGAAGAGKTRLAAQAALELREHFAGGLGMVEAAGTSGLWADAARALGMGSSEEELANGLVELDEDALLVVDGLEDGEAARERLAEIMSASPRLHVLVTARQAIGLEGEQVIEVEPLPQPGNDDMLLESSSAAQLFLESARRADPDFDLRREDEPALRQILGAVGGTPLGLEMAGAWAPLLGLRELARGIEYYREKVNANEGEAGLQAVIDCFWSLLSEDERRALRRLACFEGSFDWMEAKRAAGASPFLLDSLEAKAALYRAGPRRYRMPEALREDIAKR